ncbi:MAG: MFS transporter [Acidothermus cellulolyticus]|nr:MFS transporter [Acidothermus cellulolyticus]
MAGSAASTGTIRSTIPARLDRLRWSGFHTRLVAALGVAWILDGLEITVASAVGSDLTKSSTLHMSSGAVGDIATWYLIGEVVGAIGFGYLSDRLGRRNLFTVTLAVYLIGSALTAATWSGTAAGSAYLYLTRVIAGAGIGGEYAAINSAIDELIPARYRGRVDIAVNGTYWAGSIIGTLATLEALNRLPESWSWRVAFLAGPILALVIIYVRRNLPESPRWLVMHGRADEAEQRMQEIERRSGEAERPMHDRDALEVRPSPAFNPLSLAKMLVTRYPRRTALSASLMITQSFLYNAIFFTYTLVLTKFYHISAGSAPWYLLAFAAGNLAGPLVLGRLFDTWGRRIMIAGTYLISAALLAVSAALFDAGRLTATSQTIWWSVIFFFASAGASSAYLTVSEIFPLEIRAQAIAVFFAVAQAFGAAGPHIYGHLIGDGSDPTKLFVAYLLGAVIMALGGIAEIIWGLAAERRSLEDVAAPIGLVRRSPGFGLQPGRVPAR